jgi:hypothetical protein
VLIDDDKEGAVRLANLVGRTGREAANGTGVDLVSYGVGIDDRNPLSEDSSEHGSTHRLRRTSRSSAVARLREVVNDSRVNVTPRPTTSSRVGTTNSSKGLVSWVEASQQAVGLILSEERSNIDREGVVISDLKLVLERRLDRVLFGTRRVAPICRHAMDQRPQHEARRSLHLGRRGVRRGCCTDYVHDPAILGPHRLTCTGGTDRTDLDRNRRSTLVADVGEGEARVDRLDGAQADRWTLLVDDLDHEPSHDVSGTCSSTQVFEADRLVSVDVCHRHGRTTVTLLMFAGMVVRLSGIDKVDSKNRVGASGAGLGSMNATVTPTSSQGMTIASRLAS